MEPAKQELYSNEVNEIVKSRAEFINRNYLAVRKSYQDGYDWPELDPLRHEISLCLIFGLHQAAITLTNHLLESLLKNALIVHGTKLDHGDQEKRKSNAVESFVALFRPARKKFAANDLGDNINRACSAGLIDKDQKKELHKIRDGLRNAYSHSDKDKTFGEQTIHTQAMHLEDGKFIVEQRESTRLAELLLAHGLAQAMQAEQEAIPYFLYMDQLARQIREKLFGPVDKNGGGADGESQDDEPRKPSV
jgi:hypothetical protein